ncbi:MAG TPA: hypothetical protein VFW35_06790 [Sphingomicrobium sp.]|nr:hypothetical protein [Sphingomicrobium sp.]
MNKFLLLTGMFVLSATGSSAQMMDHATMNHDVAAGPGSESGSAAVPVEAGQAAYAALGEAVRILLADPQTDWSAVDVDALRNHLIDMDNVTLRAAVTKSKLANGAVFHVTGEGPVIGSIQRMTRSHFAQSDLGKPWTMRVQPTPTGADVTVVSNNPADAAQIYGLGFFGILTMGSHHQPHHLMMARGMMHH